MATGRGKAGGQEVISVALRATPTAEGLTSEGWVMPTLEVEAGHLLFSLLASGLTHRPRLSDWHVASLA